MEQVEQVKQVEQVEQVEQVGTNFENGKLKIKQPRKIQDKYFSKVKYLPEPSNGNDPGDLIIQLPKMKLMEPLVTKSYSSLEFLNTKGNYSSKVKKNINIIDTRVVDTITLNCEKWFDKKIPLEVVSNMYQRVLIDDSIKVFVDKPIVENHKNEILSLSDLSPGENIECIIRIKYLVFTQNECYLTWELVKVKKCQVKIKRVKKYGFIEPDPESGFESDPDSDSDLNEIEQSYSFF